MIFAFNKKRFIKDTGDQESKRSFRTQGRLRQIN